MERHRELSQSRAEETRARILRTAREAFAEHGFDGASVREIARSAETTHSMITYHFGSKERLWRESVQDMFRRLEDEVSVQSAEDADLPLRERFRRSTERYIRYCARYPEHARITIAETIRGGERLQWMVDEFVRQNHANAAPMFEELVAAGLCPDRPVIHLIYSYVAMCQLPFVLAKEAELAYAIDLLDEAALRQQAETVLALFLPPAQEP